VDAERGFTLVEVVVSTAIAAILAVALLSLVHVAVIASASTNARVLARGSTDRLAGQLETDALGAWSVFVPADDVLGASNSDGHELDFVSEDGSHRQVWWAYAYDAAAQNVTRYAYAPGTPARPGDVFEGIAGFSARTFAVTAVGDSSSAIYDPLFAGAVVTPVEFDYGLGGNATGGNHLVRVRLFAAGVNHELLLASGTAPTHYTEVLEYTPPP